MKHDRFARGSIIIMFAFALIILIGFAGLALDAGIGYGVKAKLNAAVDAASIAASRAVSYGATDDDRRASAITAGQNFYYGNFPAGYLGATPNAPTITPVHLSNGSWRVTVSGSASSPTYLMRIFGIDHFDVAATGEAIRRDLDMELVMDISGSLSSVFSQVKSSAKNFISKFDEGSDRIGLVVFSDGAEVRQAIPKSGRGFNKTQMLSRIDSLSSQSYTATGEAMRQALNDMDAIPAASRSSLRVIVLFSDGAPNTVAAVYPRHNSSGTQTGTVTGTLASGTGNSNPTLCTSSSACTLYRYDRVSTALSNYSDIRRLPINAGTTFDSLPLSSFNNKRTFSPALNTNGSVTRCNVNKAARNMLENLGNQMRSENIFVFTLGLGDQLNGYEGITSCGYGMSEYGANLLKRVANTSGVDTYNSAQPTGTYVYAANASELDSAFNKIASEIIRLSR